MERARRGKGKKKLLGSHQRSWLWGRHLVTELLRDGRWPIVHLLLADDLPGEDLNWARATSTTLDVPCEVVSRAVLQQRSHSSEHQGYLAQMGPFPYAEPATLLADQPAAPFYLMLDRLQDPYNFGAILRSAEVFGVNGVLVPTAEQVPVTSMVARSSAGAICRIPVARVDDLPHLAGRLRAGGMQVVAASEKGTQPLDACDFRGPTVIVIGNEGRGIRSELLKVCSGTVTIPQIGQLNSLNAAAACAVFCYEVNRQRQKSPTADVDPVSESKFDR